MMFTWACSLALRGPPPVNTPHTFGGAPWYYLKGGNNRIFVRIDLKRKELRQVPYPFLTAWTLWYCWLESALYIPQASCLPHCPSWGLGRGKKLPEVTQQIGNRGGARTMPLSPYTGFGGPEPDLLHTCCTPVCWDRKTEINWIFVCALWNQQHYMATPCSFIYLLNWESNHQLLSRQHTRPCPLRPSNPVWLPLPPLPSFLPSSHLHFAYIGFRYLFSPEAFPASPKSGQGASLPRAHPSLYHTVLQLLFSLSVSLTRPSAMQARTMFTAVVPGPRAGLTHNRWPWASVQSAIGSAISGYLLCSHTAGPLQRAFIPFNPCGSTLLKP